MNDKIGYARVSTNDQDLSLQLDALEKEGCIKIYSEKISGASEARPELQNAIAYLRAGDTLVVWRLDRLARSLKDLISLVNSLGEKGIHFKSITENIETNSINGRLVFHIFAALAEFERDLIRSRTQAGLEAARARGRKGGRPNLLNDQQKEKLQKLIKDSSLTPIELQKMFGVTRSTLYRYAKNKEEVKHA